MRVVGACAGTALLVIRHAVEGVGPGGGSTERIMPLAALLHADRLMPGGAILPRQLQLGLAAGRGWGGMPCESPCR